MIIQCSNCGAEIPAENINIQQTLAVCSQCNNVFDFSEGLKTQKVKRRKVKQPDRIHVHEDADSLEIYYQRVFSYEDWIIAFISGFMGLVMSIVLALILSESNVPFELLLFVSAFPLVGFYTLLSLILNTTRITLDEDSLRIRRGPIPYPSLNTKMLETHDIVRVVMERNEEPKKAGYLTPYYHIMAELSDGSRVALFKSMPDKYAHFITQQLENTIQGEVVPDIVMNSGRLDVAQDDTDLSVDDVDMIDPSESAGHLLG